MSATTRRDFLQTTACAAGAAALSTLPSFAAAGANDRIGLAIIGPGGMGMDHLRRLAPSAEVVITHVCDPDENRLREAVSTARELSQREPKAVKDMREIFADSAVDAVLIATPDHWHTPAALLALAAGKHVYVEKPCSHNIREGRLLVNAALKANKTVQVGTQSRSSEIIREAMDLLREGAIGEILVAKAWNSQLRSNIGRAQPAPPPPTLDFDLWLGPAPTVPYRSNLLHSSWRWFEAFGAGDAGNDGVHDLDIARWGLAMHRQPSRISALGGKYFFDDDQEFPDTQYVVFEYDEPRRRQLIYEHRIWSPYVQEGHENGNAFYGTKGMLILGKGKGWQLYGPRNKLIKEKSAGLDLALHHRNFFHAIRTGQKPNADAETGHLSASLAHLANLATLAAGTLQFDAAREQITNRPELASRVRRTYRPGHWAVPADA